MFNFIYEYGYYVFWGTMFMIFLYFLQQGMWVACALDDYCTAENLRMISGN